VGSSQGREFAKSGVLNPHFHRYLIEAQALRQSGDYGTGPLVTSALVDQALQRAQEFIAAAEAFLS
jgi:uncharacterized protein (UPF0332 family)